MKYAGLDIHTKNIVYTVISEDESVVMQGKIENDADEIDEFLNNFEKNDQFVMESHDYCFAFFGKNFIIVILL